MSFVTRRRNGLAAVGLLLVMVGCESDEVEVRESVTGDTNVATVDSSAAAPTLTPQLMSEAEAVLAREEAQLAEFVMPTRGRPTECGMGSGAVAGPIFIGPAGGTLEHPGGHLVTVPAGALQGYRLFMMRELPSPEIKVLVIDIPGDSFAKPDVTVTVSYSRCTGGERADSLFRNGNDGISNVTGSNSGSAITSTPLGRLSNFALATN
jgi:hypothetical protein